MVVYKKNIIILYLFKSHVIIKTVNQGINTTKTKGIKQNENHNQNIRG